jgi:hypothetical protein
MARQATDDGEEILKMGGRWSLVEAHAVFRLWLKPLDERGENTGKMSESLSCSMTTYGRVLSDDRLK